MAFLRPLRPLAISFFGLSLPSTRQSSSSSASTCTRYLWRQPSPAATRESPFPLVFVRARGVPSASPAGEVPEETWGDWSGMFAEKGYTGIEIDIQAPTPAESVEETTKSVLDSMTTMLASQIRLMAIPFAPIIISSGPSSTMLTQNYISSHPASGLVIVNPPEGEQADAMFDYEPSFPILVVNGEGSSKGRLGKAAEQGTGRGGKGVEIERIVDGERGEKTRVVSRLSLTQTSSER
jgi:hypothetical protein